MDDHWQRSSQRTLVGQMDIENLHVPIGKIIPILDGELAADVDFNGASSLVFLAV